MVISAVEKIKAKKGEVGKDRDWVARGGGMVGIVNRVVLEPG